MFKEASSAHGQPVTGVRVSGDTGRSCWGQVLRREEPGNQRGGAGERVSPLLWPGRSLHQPLV